MGHKTYNQTQIVDYISSSFNFNTLRMNKRISIDAECMVLPLTIVSSFKQNYKRLIYFSVDNCTVPTVQYAIPVPFSTIDYNSDVTYTCQDGYSHTTGTLTRSCKADGTLTGSPPVCTSK